MAYTPINWQNGDIITAEKMNKMDNGWGVSSTQIFSETVTTSIVEQEPAPLGMLAYTSLIEAPSLTVTFGNSTYTVPLVELEFGNLYGEMGESGPDFSMYPFLILSTGDGNAIYTETAGTYNVTASTEAVAVSNGFVNAVNASVVLPVFKIVAGTTTFQEACNAFKSDKPVYVVDNSSSGKTYHMPVILVNENAFEIKFVTTATGDSTLMLSGLTATSADGVLE